MNFWKIKSIIFLIYLLFIHKHKEVEKKELSELKYYFSFLLHKDKPINSSLIMREKNYILKLFSKYFNKTISENTFILNTRCNFGNCLIILNKVLFICEIIGCKNIILNKDIYWFIKRNITITNNNLLISVNQHENYNNNSSIIFNSFAIYYLIFTFRPEIRIHYLREEILRNIPTIAVNNLYDLKEFNFQL